MIVVDTSVWIDHLREGDEALAKLLNVGSVMLHPFVVGEIALGSLRQRDLVLRLLQDLPQATVATNQEALHFINLHKLFGFGIGYVDAHLLSAVRLTPGALLWTRDNRLKRAAEQLNMTNSSLS